MNTTRFSTYIAGLSGVFKKMIQIDTAEKKNSSLGRHANNGKFSLELQALHLDKGRL